MSGRLFHGKKPGSFLSGDVFSSLLLYIFIAVHNKLIQPTFLLYTFVNPSDEIPCAFALALGRCVTLSPHGFKVYAVNAVTVL